MNAVEQTVTIALRNRPSGQSMIIHTRGGTEEVLVYKPTPDASEVDPSTWALLSALGVSIVGIWICVFNS